LSAARHFQYDSMVMSARQGYRRWIVAIMLVGAALRLLALANIPPGLTHDEADHGLDAWGVVEGVRPIYFTVGYGREPLFDYATAVLMGFMGPTFLAGRLTAVFFGLVLIAGLATWSRLAFGRRVALWSAAGLAVSFWPIMTARQALRSESLPALLVLSLCLFWLAARREVHRPEQAGGWRRYGLWLAAGLALGLTFYTYIPARAMWLTIPLAVAYLALSHRRQWRQLAVGAGLTLLTAALIGLPLFIYLQQNPEAEARLEQLTEPLDAARSGDLGPLWANIVAGAGLLISQGDSAWRYNLPGRPLLEPGLAILLIPGLLVAGYLAGRRSGDKAMSGAAALVCLVWLGLGLLPALLTGPALSVTRAIGAQPVAYIFPALALDSARAWLRRRAARRAPVALSRQVAGRIMVLTSLLVYGPTLLAATSAYFGRWANAPEVRLQYEATLVKSLGYLNRKGQGATAISTATPGRFHSPAVAGLFLTSTKVDLRWFDGRHSLLLPADDSATLLFTGLAPLDPALAAYFQRAIAVETLPLRPTDLDRPVTIMQVESAALAADLMRDFDHSIVAPTGLEMPLPFGEHVTLLGYDLQTPLVSQGDEVRLATLWRVERPLAEAVLFTHLLDAGRPVAQADRLDAPSSEWHGGDVLIQLHRFAAPTALANGAYALAIGVYTRPDGNRLLADQPGAAAADLITLTTVQIMAKDG
jgi:hypothetical protein